MPGNRVIVAIYDNAPLAEVARLRLEDAGIPVRIENADVVTALWHYGTALGDVRLIVDEDHAEAARELLVDIHQSVQLTDEPEQDPNRPACLACGAELSEDADRCAACGWSYTDDAEPERPLTADEADDGTEPEHSTTTVGRAESGALSRVRNVGLPFISLWVALSIAAIMMGGLTCVLTVLDDLFR